MHKRILEVDDLSFDALTMEVFNYQSKHCKIYNRFLELLHIDTTNIKKKEDIPFLPIEFFKNFTIADSDSDFETVFESSSTTGIGASKHFVRDLKFYLSSCKNSFSQIIGDPANYCHLALLPSYIERGNSSLIAQVSEFINLSQFKQSSFFLHHQDTLKQTLQSNIDQNVPTVLWGVTYALLDFAEQYPMPLNDTIVMETGGMKGRRKEITRTELHDKLIDAFGVQQIYGEYGMTELMSQAYSKSNGLYQCPNTMRIHIREINDPFSGPIYNRHGAVNIIDLTNLHSCSFISTSDLGKAKDPSIFEILGRIDHSDTRGCNLMLS